MTSERKPHTFHHFDLISIIGFLKRFTFACNTNREREEATMCLFHISVNKNASAVLNASLNLDGSGEKRIQSGTGKMRDFAAYKLAF